MRSIDKVSKSSTAAIVALTADLGGAIAFLSSPPLRTWFAHHQTLVTCIGIFIIGVLISAIGGLQLKLDHQKSQLATLSDELTKLKRRLNPTVHDQQLFREIMSTFPWRQGLMPYLDQGFDGKRWLGRKVDPLYNLTIEHKESYFDEGTMQASFRELMLRAIHLANWLSSEGAPTEGDIYTIAGGHEREGGYQAFDAARNRGLQLSAALRDARREFEKAGREHGLWTAEMSTESGLS